MIKLIAASILCLLSLQAHADRPSDEIMDSCLLFGKAVRSSILIFPIDGPEVLQDYYEVPGYMMFKPGFKSNSLGVGYAVSKRSNDDFVAVGRHRGYVNRAISLGKYRPERIDPPELAFYAVIREDAQQYVCAAQSNGNGSAAFLRSAFVARIPPGKSTGLTLYFKMVDVKKLEKFNDDKNKSSQLKRPVMPK